MVMLTLLVRSLCQWIVNKTWWDVTYNIMKHLDLLSNYYLTSFVLMGIAALGPLLLYDTALVKETCCGGNTRGLAHGLLLRSLSREEGYNSLSISLDPNAPDDDTGGRLSGPTADESEEGDRPQQVLRVLRQDNARLQEKVAQLEKELAAAGRGVVRDLL